MALPADFDRDRWLDPLAYQGLVGAAIAHGVYDRLFRSDGFAKPIDELKQDKRIARLFPHAISQCIRQGYSEGRGNSCEA